MSETRTDNDFLLGTNGTAMVPRLPLRISTRQQAYRTAAWIKLMGEVLPDEDPASGWDEVHDAIANT